MKKKRALKIFATIVVVIVLLVALLPTILSLGPVRSLILNRANAEIDGSLSVESWSLSWFRGPSVEGIDFDDGQGTRLQVDSFVVSCRPVDVLGTTKDLGEVTVKNPVVSIVLPPASGRKAGPAPGGGGGKGGKGSPRPSKKPAPEPFRLDWDALGCVKVEGGCFRVISADGEKPFEIDGLDVAVDITSLKKPIDVKVAARDVVVAIKNTNATEEVHATFQTAVKLDIPGDKAAVDSLQLNSTPVTLSCAGTITDLRTSGVLDVAGKLKCNFARISELVAAVSPGTKLIIEGDEERDFSAHVVLDSADWVDMLRTANMQARLYIKRMEKFGIDARNFDAVLEVRDAKAQATLKTSVNDGEMLVVPLVDVSGEKPQLGMPDDSQLLKGVKIYKYVKNAPIELHVTGTVTKPVISKESMSATLRNLVREASKNLVEEKGKDGLGEKGKKLIDDLIKDEDKKKKARDVLDGLLKKVK